MPRKWYVVTAAREGARLGIYDNWLELAPLVKDDYGRFLPAAEFQGYDSLEEARVVWHRTLPPGYSTDGHRVDSRLNSIPPPAYENTNASRQNGRQRENTSRTRSARIRANNSQPTPAASSQRTQRNNSARIMTRSQTMPTASERLEGPRATVDTSTGSESDRTSNWVAELTNALPPVRESRREGTVQSGSPREDPRSPRRERERRTENASVQDSSTMNPRVSLDTSYSTASAITISSDASSSPPEQLSARRTSHQRSASARVAPLRRMTSESQTPNSPQRLVDSGNLSARRGPYRSLPSSSVSEISQNETATPQRSRLSRADSSRTLSIHGEVLSSPREVLNLNSQVRGSSSSNSLRSERITRRAEQIARQVAVSESVNASLTCNCNCPRCPLPKSSGVLNRTFAEPPHIVSIVLDDDPRSPVRNGSTRNPAGSSGVIGRPSPLAGISLFSH